MQNSLSNELRGVIESHLRTAHPKKVLAIASALCDHEIEIAGSPAPSGPRFTVNQDVVSDSLTGLLWTRATLVGGRRNWTDAKKAAAACSIGGFSDWRLPTIQELLSIVDYSRTEPAIDTSIFECESSWYWTGTPYAGSPSVYAWFVNFGGGFSGWYGQDGQGFVRAVRPGQLIGHLG